MSPPSPPSRPAPPPPPPPRAQIAAFFQSSHFALSGASATRSKFGYILFAWYARHALPCVPINPRARAGAGTLLHSRPQPQPQPQPPERGPEEHPKPGLKGKVAASSVAAPSASPYLIEPSQKYPTVPTLSAVPDTFLTSAGGYGGISLSIVTPPHVTLQTLREAHALGVKRVWMQPGAWDWECVRDRLVGASNGQWEAFIFGGEGEGEMEPGAQEGWCVLTHGEEGLRDARRSEGGKIKEGGGGRESGRERCKIITC